MSSSLMALSAVASLRVALSLEKYLTVVLDSIALTPARSDPGWFVSFTRSLAVKPLLRPLKCLHGWVLIPFRFSSTCTVSSRHLRTCAFAFSYQRSTPSHCRDACSAYRSLTDLPPSCWHTACKSTCSCLDLLSFSPAED